MGRRLFASFGLAMLVLAALPTAAVGASTAQAASGEDRCKDGGWRNLSGDQGQPFPDQGQCIKWQREHPAPAQDTVVITGSGNVFSDISFDARSGPLGENPSGTYSYTAYGSIHVTGTVTCLSVTGSGLGAGTPENPTIAYIRGVEDYPGDRVYQVVDKGGNGFDELNGSLLGNVATNCGYLDNELVSTLTNGRATVFNADPAPR